MDVRSSTERTLEERSTMKYFYWFIAVSLVVTVLSVWFVPGVDDHIEQTFQRYLGQAAR